MKIIGVAKDSRDVKKGYAYFCFEGENVDGHDYIQNAIDAGACAIYGTKPLAYVNYFQVSDINQAMVDVSKEVYGVSYEDFKFIGITGTDGKTSTALITHEVLKEKSAYVGTSGLIIKDKEYGYNGFTTPFADIFFPFLKQCKKEGIEYIIMEVSSHALEQNRLGDIKFHISALLNITSDHLDFHKTLENYINAKLKIKDKTSGYFLYNCDDTNLSNITGVSIGVNGSDFKISNIIENKNGLSFNINDIEITSDMLVSFNAYNLTFAYAICRLLNCEIEDIKQKIQHYIVPGRMQVVNKEPSVILDFAHTADAIRNIAVFSNRVKQDAKLIIVTGSAGGRDKTKRPLMGKAASEFADILILTEDDPRSESVSEINKEIKSGIENSNCEVIDIVNRAEAIDYAISIAKKEDMILLLGKAGQTVMYYADGAKDYIEQDVVMNALLKE